MGRRTAIYTVFREGARLVECDAKPFGYFFAAAKKWTPSRSEWKPCRAPLPASQGREQDSEFAEAVRQRLHRRARAALERGIEEAQVASTCGTLRKTRCAAMHCARPESRIIAAHGGSATKPVKKRSNGVACFSM